jgi:hypothetical protein
MKRRATAPSYVPATWVQTPPTIGVGEFTITEVAAPVLTFHRREPVPSTRKKNSSWLLATFFRMTVGYRFVGFSPVLLKNTQASTVRAGTATHPAAGMLMYPSVPLTKVASWFCATRIVLAASNAEKRKDFMGASEV